MARQILEAIADGILGGGVYALMAAGLTLIFGVLDIINIAQGILVVLGAYLSYVLSVHLHIDLFVGLLITIPVMFVLGVGIQCAVHQAAARQRADVDDAARLLRGGAHHRGHPVLGRSGRTSSSLNAWYTAPNASVKVFGFYVGDIYLFGFAPGRGRRGGAVPAAVPDHVRPRGQGHDAGRSPPPGWSASRSTGWRRSPSASASRSPPSAA